MDAIEHTKAYVKSELYDDASGHDWWHIYRVWNNAKLISSHYSDIDHQVIELAALLHDIADWKDHQGDFDIGPKTARIWLERFDDVPKDQIDDICHIIRHISFKGAHAVQEDLSLEGKIVQDADRLDAIGAIGIARTFAFGGSRGNLMYDPNISPEEHDEHSYVHNKKPSTTINHFYEKLLLLKDRMNTTYGREIAEHRHQFMELYLKQFYGEWNGEQ